jgi:serine/alanine adding enzyme
MGSLTVTEIKDDDAANWDRYVLGHPGATGYHLVAWRRVLEETFGHRSYYLTAKDEHGEIRGVLPLVFLASRLFGRFLVSMPFVNYGGILADSPEVHGVLLERAMDLAGELDAAHIELRHQSVLDLGWPCKQHKVSMRLDLPESFETLWKGFPSKLRSQVRRAQKEEMAVQIGREEVLYDFYQVFSRNMRDLGTPVYGRSFFATILKAFPKDTRICVVYSRSRPLAAGFLYGFRQMLEIPWASSDPQYNHLAPNMLLYSAVLEHACQQGFRVFDFGRCTPGGGTYRFKEQWGARAVPLFWYYWVRNGGAPPELHPRNPKYRIAIKVWQRLPVALTRIVGPAVVRNIP